MAHSTRTDAKGVQVSWPVLLLAAIVAAPILFSLGTYIGEQLFLAFGES